MLQDKKGKKYFFLSKRMQFNCIQNTIDGKVLQHLKKNYLVKGFFMFFLSQTAGKEFAQERCGVSLHLRGKTPPTIRTRGF